MTATQSDRGTEAPVLLERHETIALLTLNRPAQRNAMSTALVVELIDSIARLDADPEIRAIVIAGAGRGFCAGSDLAGLAGMSLVERSMFEEMSGRVARMFGQCLKPVIAAAHGFAIGGGLTLAAACDIVITDPASRWSLPEVAVGLFPAWGIPAVVARVGMPRARQLCFGVEQWDGRMAHAMGLCDHLAEGDIIDTAMDMARKLADMPQRQVAATKRYFAVHAGDEAGDNVANRLFMEMMETTEAVATFERFSDAKRAGGSDR